jgi:prevent-host-death family protein
MNPSGTLSLGTFEAKNKLSSLVDLASKGSRIWITKRGKRVALLSSGNNEAAKFGTDPITLFRAIRSRSKTGNVSMKSLVEEGRR